jgi:hypothetical protein
MLLNMKMADDQDQLAAAETAEELGSDDPGDSATDKKTRPCRICRVERNEGDFKVGGQRALINCCTADQGPGTLTCHAGAKAALEKSRLEGVAASNLLAQPRGKFSINLNSPWVWIVCFPGAQQKLAADGGAARLPQSDAGTIQDLAAAGAVEIRAALRAARDGGLTNLADAHLGYLVVVWKKGPSGKPGEM